MKVLVRKVLVAVLDLHKTCIDHVRQDPALGPKCICKEFQPFRTASGNQSSRVFLIDWSIDFAVRLQRLVTHVLALSEGRA